MTEQKQKLNSQGVDVGNNSENLISEIDVIALGFKFKEAQ